jgi:hypothetical protein
MQLSVFFQIFNFIGGHAGCGGRSFQSSLFLDCLCQKYGFAQ